MVQTKEIMTLAVEIGDIMLRSGAELYRVEDSLSYEYSKHTASKTLTCTFSRTVSSPAPMKVATTPAV